MKNIFTPWQHPYATSEVKVDGILLGYAGKISRTIWANLDFLPSSDAFFFELDLDFLKAYKPEIIKASPLSKIQEQSFDIAFLSKEHHTIDDFISILSRINDSISSVVFLDEFKRSDWQGKRSLTFRVKVQSRGDKPLSRNELEKIIEKAQKVVAEAGAEIR